MQITSGQTIVVVYISESSCPLKAKKMIKPIILSLKLTGNIVC